MDIQKEREDFEVWFAKSHYHKHLIENFWDTWQAAKAKAVPDGFVLVPKEPTPKMIDAADNCAINRKVTANIIYKAMIDAQEQSDV